MKNKLIGDFFYAFETILREGPPSMMLDMSYSAELSTLGPRSSLEMLLDAK